MLLHGCRDPVRWSRVKAQLGPITSLDVQLLKVTYGMGWMFRRVARRTRSREKGRSTGARGKWEFPRDTPKKKTEKEGNRARLDQS